MAFALRPSAAARWVNCGGYLRMAALHPERPGTDNTVREEGTAFHTAIYNTLTGRQTYSEGDVIDTGVAKVDVDDYFLECVQEYGDEVRSWNVPVYLETPLAAPEIHPECGGTPDAWAVDHDKRLIRVLDAKYGYRPVDPFEWLQGGCYLSAIMSALKVPADGYVEQFWSVEFIIYQPRCPGPSFKRWRFNLADYGRGMFNVLRDAAYRAISADGQLVAGAHCLECSAAAHCPALAKASMNFLDVIDVTESETLDTQGLAYQLRLLEYAEGLIKTRREALELDAIHRARNGEVIPGHSLEASTSRLKWNEGVEPQLIELAKAIGKGDIAKPTRAITPTQAAKILGEDFIAPFAHRPPGKLRLKRLNAHEIRKAFTK